MSPEGARNLTAIVVAVIACKLAANIERNTMPEKEELEAN